jgi:acetyltransferase-like isoleucine patch superfamily enzyme
MRRFVVAGTNSMSSDEDKLREARMPQKIVKSALAAPLVYCQQLLVGVLEGWRRVSAFAALQARLAVPLPTSTVVLGRPYVYGTGRVLCGERLLLYPNQYLETHGDGEIVLSDDVVLSTGVHLVAYAGIFIGKGSMIGEYTSIRDANHTREEGRTLRDSTHVAKPIVIGSQVWIGRGVVVLSGITIGDGATVGANAVVTRDVPPGIIVAGVPAVPIQRETSASVEMYP